MSFDEERGMSENLVEFKYLKSIFSRNCRCPYMVVNKNLFLNGYTNAGVVSQDPHWVPRCLDSTHDYFGRVHLSVVHSQGLHRYIHSE